MIGAGGLGHMAVQILKATTAANVIAVDTRAEALDLALESGADLAVPSGDDTAASIREATRERGADVVLTSSAPTRPSPWPRPPPGRSET